MVILEYIGAIFIKKAKKIAIFGKKMLNRT